jgi:hypothetical protein
VLIFLDTQQRVSPQAAHDEDDEGAMAGVRALTAGQPTV